MKERPNMPVDSEKFRNVSTRLPEDLRRVFERLVKEYEFMTQLRYGRGYVAYEVSCLFTAGAGNRSRQMPR